MVMKDILFWFKDYYLEYKRRIALTVLALVFIGLAILSWALIGTSGWLFWPAAIFLWYLNGFDDGLRKHRYAWSKGYLLGYTDAMLTEHPDPDSEPLTEKEIDHAAPVSQPQRDSH